MSSRLWWALALLFLLVGFSLGAQEKSSAPPSTDIAPVSSPTTPTDSSSSESLLATLDKAIDSSMSTDQKLLDYKEALSQEQQQRKSDNEARRKEIASWQAISEKLSSQVVTQQKSLSDFDTLLGVTSGSEAEKHAAALKAIDSIKVEARKLEAENAFLKVGFWSVVAVLGGVAVYEGGHLLKAW